jgi:hypothetical protein
MLIIGALPLEYSVDHAGQLIRDLAQVIGTDWRPIPGLLTCGEMVGGLFHFN